MMGNVGNGGAGLCLQPQRDALPAPPADSGGGIIMLPNCNRSLHLRPPVCPARRSMPELPPENLESHLPLFGLSSFRHGQKEVISTVLARRDCLCVMPTGGGKSLCYQLPAMVLEGLTLVVSPLIALMKDQVDQLESLGLPVSFVNSTLPAGRAKRAARPDGGRPVPADVRGAGAVSQRAVSRGGPRGGFEAAGRGRGTLHQRVGARFSPRLRPARLFPQAAGQPDDHRLDRHRHGPRPSRHHRAVVAARPEDLHHRLRSPQPLL